MPYLQPWLRVSRISAKRLDSSRETAIIENIKILGHRVTSSWVIASEGDQWHKWGSGGRCRWRRGCGYNCNRRHFDVRNPDAMRTLRVGKMQAKEGLSNA